MCVLVLCGMLCSARVRPQVYLAALCSDAGGIEIESNWDRLKSVTIPTLGEASSDALAPLLGGLPLELRPGIEKFIQAAYAVGRHAAVGTDMFAEVAARFSCFCSRSGPLLPAAQTGAGVARPDQRLILVSTRMFCAGV